MGVFARARHFWAPYVAGNEGFSDRVSRAHADFGHKWAVIGIFLTGRVPFSMGTSLLRRPDTVDFYLTQAMNLVMTSKPTLATSDLQGIWPAMLEAKVYEGFADTELENLISPGAGGHDGHLSYKSAAWLYWPTELYSFGRCYRLWTGWPWWLPIPLYGDHGVCLFGQLEPHELRSKPRVHLTWYKERAGANRMLDGKRVERVRHPWVVYRERAGYVQKADAMGTLVFHTHTIVGLELGEYDWTAYFSTLRELPEEYQPVVICLHRHDIAKGYHRAIREAGFPMVSAGDTSSPYFVDRFYSLLSRFKYATSNSGGSELFYSEEMGVRYFLAGKPPVLVNVTRDDRPKGQLTISDAIAQASLKKKDALFRAFPPVASEEKNAFVSDILGLDLLPAEGRRKLRKWLLIEAFRHTPEITALLLKTLAGRVRQGVARLFR
jgi:hypothetical protein